MADFVTKHDRNTRFTVNRHERIFIKLSTTEKENWLDLVWILQRRRNTGTQVDTFIYLMKKYQDQKQVVEGLVRNARFSVDRKNGCLFKISENELSVWKTKVANHGGSQVECFMDMVNAEYHFQDKIEVVIIKR